MIKLHTPAGRVRVVKRIDHARNVPPGSLESDTRFSSQQKNTMHGAHAALEGASSFAPSNVLDLDQRLKDEYKAGFEEGRRFTEKRLRDELAAQLAENKSAVETLTANVLRGYERWQASVERNVVKLALAVAERIVKREIVFDNEIVLRQIHEGARRVIGVERIKIRVNPVDEEFVRDHRSQILVVTDAVRELVIEGDGAIARGGCILESDSGNVDTLIATQLERIEAAMLGETNEK